LEYTTLEDELGDIVGKARRGQGISEGDLGKSAGLSPADIGRLEAYELMPDERVVRALAEALGLHPAKLVRIAQGWCPTGGNARLDTGPISVDRVAVQVGGMAANCYLLKCGDTGKAAIVDPGAEGERILATAEALQAEVTHVLITHGHGDHVGALGEVCRALSPQVCCPAEDVPMLRGNAGTVDVKVAAGWSTSIGHTTVEAVGLPGHTPGSTGYVANGAFFSGDAAFAGSLGGARGAGYRGQIEAVARGMLARAPQLRIFPGHGPSTTVGQERENNPFFV